MNLHFFKKFSFLGLILLISTIVTFQNCSKVKFEPTDDSIIDQQSILPPGLSRLITLKPQYNQISNLNPIKVLLIVDNSETMSFSQTNLANNMNNLLKSIKDYEAEVMIISTSVNEILGPQSETSTALPGGLNESITLTPFKNKIPKFKFSKTFSTTANENQVSAISNYVKGLGVSGNNSEAPLAAMALALDDETKFFSKGDNVLIYVITDENDISSTGAFLPMLKYIRMVGTGGETVFNPVPGYRISYTYHLVRIYKRIPILGDSGNIIGYGSEEQTPLRTNSAAECQALAATYPQGDFTATCDSGATNGLEGPLNGQTIDAFCAMNLAYHGALMTLCQGITYQQSTYIPGSILSNETVLKYFLNIQQADITGMNPTTKSKFIYQTIKNKMDTLFESKYLISVQANISTQSCGDISNNQTYDKTFEEFGNLFSTSNFYRASICDTNGINGSALKDIAVRFQNILETKYLVTLAQNEEITSVVLHQGSKSTILKVGVDYQLDGASFQLLKSELEQFDRIEVNIRSF